MRVGGDELGFARLEQRPGERSDGIAVSAEKTCRGDLQLPASPGCSACCSGVGKERRRPLRMCEHRQHSGGLEALARAEDLLHPVFVPALERALEQGGVEAVEPVPAQIVIAVRNGRVDFEADADPELLAFQQLCKPCRIRADELLAFFRQREVVVHVWRDVDERRPSGGGEAAELDSLVDRLHAVVTGRDHVRVDVDEAGGHAWKLSRSNVSSARACAAGRTAYDPGMRRAFAIGIATALAATVIAGSVTGPAASSARGQSFDDVARSGLVWRGHRFHDVASFSRWLRRHGTTYAAWARRHVVLSLALWQHVLCAPSCDTALAGRELRSWNPHVRCRPLLTTIPRLLGNRRSALGGATEAGGVVQPHLTGRRKRALSPPCLVGAATPTFVELDGGQISTDFLPPADGDRVFNVTDAARTELPEPMRTMHIEIDGTWRSAGVAPSAVIPPVGARVDLQGYVYWDSEHTDEAWHSFSGWELHPLAAWRLAR
jgi:hypothetical protein